MLFLPFHKTFFVLGLLLIITACSEDTEKPILFAPEGNIATFPKDDGQNNIAKNGSIVIEFGSEILASSVDSNSVELEDINGLIAGNVELADTGRHLVFTPTDTLSILSQYTVTVLSTVVGLDKQAFDAGPYTFVTRDGSWTNSEVKLVTTQAASPINVQSKIDKAGNIVVVWIDETTKTAWSNRFDNTAITPAWGTPIKIQSTSIAAFSLTLDMDDAGNTFLLWVEHDDVANTRKLWTKSYHATGTESGWSEPVEVSGALPPTLYPPPTMDFNPAGSGLMAWFTLVNNRYEIWTMHYDQSTKMWESPQFLGDVCYPIADPAYLNISIDKKGNGIAMWSGDLFVCLYQYDGEADIPVWTRPNNVTNSARQLHGYQMTPWGDIHAIWPDYTNVIACISFCFQFNYGTFSADGRSSYSTTEVYSSKFQQFNLDQMGNGYIVILTTLLPSYIAENTLNISYLPVTMQNNGPIIGTEVVLVAGELSSTGISNYHPKLSLDSKNNGYLTWVNYSDKHQIMVKRLNATSNTPTWEEPASIHTAFGLANADAPQKPSVSFNSIGQGVAIWSDNQKIYANRFE